MWARPSGHIEFGAASLHVPNDFEKAQQGWLDLSLSPLPPLSLSPFLELLPPTCVRRSWISVFSLFVLTARLSLRYSPLAPGIFREGKFE